MDGSSQPLSQVIGSRVRQARQHHGWTLDQLAEAASVSRRMVVNVEQGSSNPSIGILLRLSDALGIGLPSLVEPPQREQSKVTPAGDGAVLWQGERGGRGLLVAGTDPPDVVELWDWTLMPTESHTSEAHTTGTKELLQVQAGTLVVTVANVPHTLEPGDAITFAGDEDHSYTNPSSTATRFSLAVYEPGVGAAHQLESRNA